MVLMVVTGGQARAPSIPVSAPISSRSQEQFQEIKQALDNMASWELADKPMKMKFTEGGNERQEKTFMAVLGK